MFNKLSDEDREDVIGWAVAWCSAIVILAFSIWVIESLYPEKQIKPDVICYTPDDVRIECP